MLKEMMQEYMFVFIFLVFVSYHLDSLKSDGLQLNLN